MLVKKEDAVVVCQEFGFATADGWSEPKLLRKLEELVTLYRSGEWTTSMQDVVAVLDRLAKGAGEAVAIRDDGDENDDGDGNDDGDDRLASELEDDEDAIKDHCLLDVGDRVVVGEEGVDRWKGIVDEILTDDSVMVRDRRGETWETTVDKCEVKIRATEVEKEKKAAKLKPEKSGELLDEDDEAAEIRSLKERIQALKSRKKSSGGRKNKLRRDEIAVRVLWAHPEGGVLERLAEEVDVMWKKQGRQENPHLSVSTLKRVVRVGVLFGLLRLDGRKVSWVVSKEG